jgi:hypothetical protein
MDHAENFGREDAKLALGSCGFAVSVDECDLAE